MFLPTRIFYVKLVIQVVLPGSGADDLERLNAGVKKNSIYRIFGFVNLYARPYLVYDYHYSAIDNIDAYVIVYINIDIVNNLDSRVNEPKVVHILPSWWYLPPKLCGIC